MLKDQEKGATASLQAKTTILQDEGSWSMHTQLPEMQPSDDGSGLPTHLG